MNKKKKEIVLTSSSELLAKAKYLIFIQHNNLNSYDWMKLKGELSINNAQTKHLKNAVTKKAIDNRLFQIQNILTGPTAIVYSNDKKMYYKKSIDILKRYTNIEILCTIIDNTIVHANQSEYLMKLPTIEESYLTINSLLTQNISNIQKTITNASGLNLYNLMNAIHN